MKKIIAILLFIFSENAISNEKVLFKAIDRANWAVNIFNYFENKRYFEKTVKQEMMSSSNIILNNTKYFYISEKSESFFRENININKNKYKQIRRNFAKKINNEKFLNLETLCFVSKEKYIEYNFIVLKNSKKQSIGLVAVNNVNTYRKDFFNYDKLYKNKSNEVRSKNPWMYYSFLNSDNLFSYESFEKGGLPYTFMDLKKDILELSKQYFFITQYIFQIDKEKSEIVMLPINGEKDNPTRYSNFLMKISIEEKAQLPKKIGEYNVSKEKCEYKKTENNKRDIIDALIREINKKTKF